MGDVQSRAAGLQVEHVPVASLVATAEGETFVPTAEALDGRSAPCLVVDDLEEERKRASLAHRVRKLLRGVSLKWPEGEGEDAAGEGEVRDGDARGQDEAGEGGLDDVSGGGVSDADGEDGGDEYPVDVDGSLAVVPVATYAAEPEPLAAAGSGSGGKRRRFSTGKKGGRKGVRTFSDLGTVSLSLDVSSSFREYAVCPELVVGEGPQVWSAALRCPRPSLGVFGFSFTHDDAGGVRVCNIKSQLHRKTISGLNGVIIVELVRRDRCSYELLVPAGEDGARMWARATVGRSSLSGNVRIVLRLEGDKRGLGKRLVLAVLLSQGDSRWAVFNGRQKCAAKGVKVEGGFGHDIVCAGGCDSLVVLCLGLMLVDFHSSVYNVYG